MQNTISIWDPQWLADANAEIIDMVHNTHKPENAKKKKLFFSVLYARLQQIVSRNAQRSQWLFVFYVFGTLLALFFGLPALSDLTLLIPDNFAYEGDDNFLLIVDLHDLSPQYMDMVKKHLVSPIVSRNELVS